MADLQINKVPFRLEFETYSIFISQTFISGFQESKNNIREEFIDKFIPAENDKFFYSFEPHSEAQECILDVKKNRYFLFPYIDYIFFLHFQRISEENKFVLRRNFINGIEVWIKLDSENGCTVFERYSIRITDKAYNRPFAILLTYEGESYVLNKSLDKIDDIYSSLIRKVVINREVYLIDEISDKSHKNAYPVLSNKLKLNLNIPINKKPYGFNVYKEYYTKIHQFYNRFISGNTFLNKIYISEKGFIIIPKTQISNIKFTSNTLEFKAGRDTNILNGLKLYGPYQPPATENVKFIFIYRESRRMSANALYGYLTKGYANAFPNFKQFLRVEQFNIDIQNSIKLTGQDDVNEIQEKIKLLAHEKDIQYFAFYLTENNRINSDSSNDENYYLIKYILINNNILSQFIYYKNIEEPSFKYFLPNIAIAVAAKLNGIPWRLDVKSKDTIVIGFSVKQNGQDKFLGNTLCFDDKGVFFSFDSFEQDTPNSLVHAFELSIRKIVKEALGVRDFTKIVIHYYKTLGKREASIIESVLKSFQLDIPYIVLTINETDSRDFIVFDTSSQLIMPVSGTIIEIRTGTDYLLTNNERYSEVSSLKIKKFPFPIKIKINATNTSYQEAFDVHDLIEQVYAFSRIYWKSVSQISIPVTMKYSKIIADISSHFPSNKLPDNRIAHKNLWFL